MTIQPITVKTMMDTKVFTDFSHFNSFRLNKRWLSLVLFPVIIVAFGFVNLFTGSRLLFYVFCAAGIVLPLLYLLFYRVSIKKQIVAYQLEIPRCAYTVFLSKDGVAVSNEKEQAKLDWERVYRVFELDDYTYVYITKARAFILPHRDIADGTPEQLHQLFLEYLPSVRLFVKRKNRT